MLTERQEAILKIIVEDYTRTAAPISSEAIARSSGLSVSSATIRNDVGALREEGFISHPHTSAGSVPLDKAYRFYVEALLAEEPAPIPAAVTQSVKRQLSEIERDVDEWANVSAAVLSQLVGNMAIATFPKAKESRIRHLDLVYMQDLVLMLIVVLEQTHLRRQLIRLEKPIDLAEIEGSANRLRSNLMGLSRSQIEAKAMTFNPLEEELVSATISVLEEEDKAVYRDHYVDGLRNLLSQPEFVENDMTRLIVEGMENGSLVQAILGETPDGNVVRVIIGQENKGDALLWPLSIVISRYGIPNEAMGTVGVIGPTRMEYSRTISGVRIMSSAMSDLVESVYLS
ncbi:MAG: heat-inducible transcription repressor HrcA [SAR202 cluster bacterium Casp-Chloro-G4]|nr:heat-inducible transcriptional repressor HrcA [Chloroflexota bacterium]MDA1227352.1 heat-inducible transcriptional repressor HrcA [Chloroflexota bacterium]PKB61804.1 MAG: heat-inducible transcription repressor HrcA [SAR202 cluster bacterium Casp-Chloro-G4]